MKDVFVRSKPCRMLVILKEDGAKHISEIARESNATYVHTTKLVRELEKEGIVTIEKNGKKRMVKLTGEGTKIAGLIADLMAAFEDKAKQSSA